MTRKTRQILFWSCFIVFAVTSPALVLFARGYRFDFVKKKFVATGAIFIKSDPEGAIISVNGIKRGYTPGVFGDVLTKPSLISNILPGEYDVRVEKLGYVPWVKKLTVRPRQVTEARSIFLFAESKPKTLYFTSIADSLVSPDAKEAVVVSEGSITSWIVLINTKKPSEQNTVYAEKKQTRASLNPKTTLESFSPDDRTLMFKKERKGTLPSLFTVSLDKPYDLRAMPKFPSPSDKLQKAAFTDKEHVVFLDAHQTLWRWKNLSSEIPTRASASAWGFAVHNDRLYTLEGYPPMLFAYTADGTAKTQISTMPVDGRTVPAKLFIETLPDNALAFLVIPEGSKDGTVRLADRDGKLRDVQKGVESFRISPDGKKMLTKTWNELWVHYFDDILTQPIHKNGEVMLVGRFGTGVKEAQWHPTSGDYILYTVPDGLFAIELDDRGGKRNTIELVRNGDIALRSITREGLFFTAQEHLAFFSWRPEEK
ncbi:MAG: PEGA domain-containing protein [bacterium]|nr:PEGA domain-containing protein [bacterium]